MNEAGSLHFLGFGARAGKLVYGQAKCTAGIRRGTIKMLILDGSVSQGTLKSFTDACRTHNVPWVLLMGHDVLGPSVGRPECRLVGITDPDFARSMSEKFGIESGRGAD